MDVRRDLFFAQQSLAMLFSVTNKLQMQGDKYLGDLSIRQMLALPAIFHAPEGEATINHIARSLGTTKQSAKQIVDAMEKKNYLSVAPSERDKRAVAVTITPEGRQAFSACSERTDEFLADIFRDFTAQDLEALWTLLHKLYRFDGVEQDGLGSHGADAPDESDDVLKYHRNFVKRRNEPHA